MHAFDIIITIVSTIIIYLLVNYITACNFLRY